MIIGIDLGTTNSLVAVWRDNKVEVIPNHFGDLLTPSVVGLSDDGDIIVGKLAKERLMSHPKLTQAKFKRLMGTQEKLRLGDQFYLPEELSAFVLRKLVEDAEAYLGEKVDEIIVSVPAYFNDDQRAATKIAGQLAGIKIERIINEPSAAALALHQSQVEDASYLIVDFGGGTLDVSVVDAFANVIEIVSVAGDNHLGGEDFTQAIYEDLIKHLPMPKGQISSEELAQIHDACEGAKKDLDTEDSTKISVRVSGDYHQYHLTKERFFELSRQLLARIEGPIQRALRDAQMSFDDLTDIILVGGNTKMKLVKDYLTFLTQRPLEVQIDQDQAIAMGCGVAAGIKARKEEIKDMVLTDICPFTLGTAIVGNVSSPIIERNSILPASFMKEYCTSQLGQSHIRCDIYQGEHYRADQNLLLGVLEVPVPVNYQEHEVVHFRFSYDINGILDVDVTVVSTGEVFSKTIMRDRHQMSEAEIAERRQALANLKIHPKDKETYQLLMAKAERLYQNLLAEDREMLAKYIGQYEQVVNSQDLKKIKQAETVFAARLKLFERAW